MIDTIIWIIIGAFIGWNLPQPSWAKTIQEKIQSFISKKNSI